MTVGISFTNGLEAIVVTDSREVGGMRQSDSVNKIGQFSREQYHGVIFGSGNGNVIEGVTQNLDQFSGDAVNQYVSSILSELKERLQKNIHHYFEMKKQEIDSKSSLIADEQERKQFAHQEISKAMQEYDKHREDSSHNTRFVLVAYDRTREKVRQFFIDEYSESELFLKNLQIGSGADGASFYFTTTLSGVDNTTLKPAELAFFAVNAYTVANVNVGVGGSPRIALVSKEKIRIVPPEDTKLLANLSGAFLSGYHPALTTTKTREYFRRIMATEDFSPEEIAQLINLNPDALQSLVIPYSSWLERVNMRDFGNGGKE